MAFKILKKQIDIMAIGFHAVVGKRQFQTEVVGKVFDEVWADIDRMLVHGFILQKYGFFLLW